jgi:YfiH family protein
LTTTRRDGHLRAPARLKKFLKTKKWPAAIATAEQVHKNHVVVASRLSAPKTFRGADGLLTDQPMQPLGIFTADCLSIFVSEETRGIVGVLHAGWRGVRSGILREAVRLMRRRWSVRPRHVQYWLGPCIGACCFEVQWDVARYFPKTRRRSPLGWRVDLAGEIKTQARRMGLRARPDRSPAAPGQLASEQYRQPAACTMHGRSYFSYRRDKTADRQISIVMRTA